MTALLVIVAIVVLGFAVIGVLTVVSVIRTFWFSSESRFE